MYFLCSWSISASYFAFHQYAFTDFLEYPLLIIQQLLLINMHMRINNLMSSTGIVSFLILYFATIYNWVQGPAWLLQILIVCLTQLANCTVTYNVLIFRALIPRFLPLANCAKFTRSSRLRMVTMARDYFKLLKVLIQHETLPI